MTLIVTSEYELQKIEPPSLPLAAQEYTAQYQDQLNNVLRLYFNRLNNVVNQLNANATLSGAGLQFPNGSFFDTGATQTAAVINTAYPVRFDSTIAANDVTVEGTPKTQITVNVDGFYDFQFSLQLSKTTGSSAYIWVWPRVNGVDIADSNTKLAIQGTSSEVVAAWNFVLPMNAGDYFQLMWATNDTNVVILKEAANAFSPAIPSSIITATFVSALY